MGTGNYYIEHVITVCSTMKTLYPIVVMKLVVNEPSEKRKRRQLLPTPSTFKRMRIHEQKELDK